MSLHFIWVDHKVTITNLRLIVSTNCHRWISKITPFQKQRKTSRWIFLILLWQIGLEILLPISHFGSTHMETYIMDHFHANLLGYKPIPLLTTHAILRKGHFLTFGGKKNHSVYFCDQIQNGSIWFVLPYSNRSQTILLSK